MERDFCFVGAHGEGLVTWRYTVFIGANGSRDAVAIAVVQAADWIVEFVAVDVLYFESKGTKGSKFHRFAEFYGDLEVQVQRCRSDGWGDAHDGWRLNVDRKIGRRRNINNIGCVLGKPGIVGYRIREDSCIGRTSVLNQWKTRTIKARFEACYAITIGATCVAVGTTTSNRG